MIARRGKAPGRWLSCPTEALLRPLLGVGRGVGCGARISDLLPTQPRCPRRGDRRRPLRAGSSGQPLLVVADLQPRMCVQPFFDSGGIEHGAVVGVPFRQGCGHACGEVAAPARSVDSAGRVPSTVSIRDASCSYVRWCGDMNPPRC